jgi:hypothetical protein
MRGLLEKDLMGDTSGHEAGALTVVRSSLKATFASGFTWAAGALAAAFMTCCGLGAWVVMPGRRSWQARARWSTSPIPTCSPTAPCRCWRGA